MTHPLDNPVYHALISGDRAFSFGNRKVKFFDESISPFAGIEQGYTNGFQELFEVLPAGRLILFATPFPFRPPAGWQQLQKAKGLQMVLAENAGVPLPSFEPLPLDHRHVDQMMALAELTKPGPFGPRTIAFGQYFGLFKNKKLVAMAGQRLHLEDYTEISAVCTHPDHLGKGYALAMVQHQARLILAQGKTPFLHVRKDNKRAVELYQRIGFTTRSAMNFYFMKRRRWRKKQNDS